MSSSNEIARMAAVLLGPFFAIAIFHLFLKDHVDWFVDLLDDCNYRRDNRNEQD